MAGEWIKMRTNLWDDPRVSRICDITGKTEAAVIGGLYWLWATADEHSTDGVLDGFSFAGIDRKVGIRGFAAAVGSVQWIEETPTGVTLRHFDEHNGASAKARALTAKRVANHKKGNAKVTQSPLPKRDPDVSTALPRIRSREEEENTNQRGKVEGLPETPPRKRGTRKIPLPPDFAISDRVRQWASERGHTRLEERFEHFVGKARANAYAYADWDEALMGAIRDDWARLNGKAVAPISGLSPAGAATAEAGRRWIEAEEAKDAARG